MTRERAKELLPVIQAFADGKQVQKSSLDGWVDDAMPTFSYEHTWRIKPELREWWIVKTPEWPRPVVYDCKQASFNGAEVIHVREVIDP